MNGKKDFVLGIMIGGLVGLAVGLITAPEPGEEARERIKQHARTSAEDFRAGAEQFAVKLKDGAEEAMRKASKHVPETDEYGDNEEGEPQQGEHEIEPGF